MEDIGPFKIDGVRMPTWIVRFDKDGTCASPETQEALVAVLSGDSPPSHVIFMSHGWNSDFADAIGQYRAFLNAFEKVESERPLGGGFRPLFVGVTWPSVWFPLDKGPALAGVLGEKEARPKVLEAFDEKGGSRKDSDRFAELTAKDRLTGEELGEAADLLQPILSGADDSDLKPDRSLDRELTIAAALRIQSLVDASEDTGRPGTFDPSRLDAPAVAGANWLDPRNLLRLFSLYEMKDRAGRIGSNGAAILLRRLLATGLPIHVVGHSFGSKVMLSAVCAPSALPHPVASMLLLQPAISHLCFADVVPGREGHGGYRSALDASRVKGRIFSTYSRSDFPLHDVFHAALRRGADLGEARIAAAVPPPSVYAALGGYGPRGAQETLIDPIKKPGDLYALAGKVKLVGLDGSAATDYPKPTADARIACHGCVANPYTAWALHQQISGG